MPYDVRDEAMIDFVKALSTQNMLVAKGKRKFFHMSFRSKREDQSIVMHSKHWKNGSFYKSFFGNEPIASSEPIPAHLGYDSRLVRDKCGKYFLCLLLPVDDHFSHQPDNTIIALDPGVRTFMT